jgi:hypothetical protein
MNTNAADNTSVQQTSVHTGYAAKEIDLFVAAVEDVLRSYTPRLAAYDDAARRRLTPVLLNPAHGG